MGLFKNLLIILPAVLGASTKAWAKHPFPSRPTTSLDSLHQVYQFPNGTRVENIAVRANGNLLVTLTSAPELYEINPFNTSHSNTTRLVHRFADHQWLTGIAELSPDVFAVAVDDSVSLVDMTGDVKISPVATLPDTLLNGMATLNSTSGRVLISDSTGGRIYAIDVYSGNYEVVLTDDTMAPTGDLGHYLGVNGLKYLDGYVYYVNSPKRLYCRVSIDPASGRAIGPYETITEGYITDDFAITPHAVAYLAGLGENVIRRAFLNGTVDIVAGSLNSSDVAGATSAAFGRTNVDRRTLYVTTNGASTAPVNGTFVEGGKVMALRV